MMVQRINTVINNALSHIQIHNPDFLSDNNIIYSIPSVNEITDKLDDDENIKAYTERIILNGMVSSSAGGYGVKITGIIPEHEQHVTTLHRQLIDGKYLEGVKRNPILIGEKLANKLKVKLRSKIVLTFQNDEGEIIAGAYRVAGIYKTVSSKYDEMNVFVKSNDIEDLLGEGDYIHEIAILANDFEMVPEVREQLKRQNPEMLVRSWHELSPELGFTNEMMDQMMYIFISIIMLALAFGIINTMLMAVLERKRELGMLMSVGMNKLRVFTMIVLETIYLSFVGGPLGILLGYLTIRYFNHRGIDLSVVGEGMKSLGYDVIVYPLLDNNFYFNIAVMVIITAILSSIYPARKALKLNPAEAVRAL
ncbi:MAG: ABC transporter permease [Bacteroidia bacterium]|nr:ABC transporter permease [Bacteroidia bacterium]